MTRRKRANTEDVPAEALTARNWDGSCGRTCPHCDFHLSSSDNSWSDWFPVAIVRCPFTRGGQLYVKSRPFAIVKRCPKCFELSWYHGDEHDKRFFKEVLAEREPELF